MLSGTTVCTSTHAEGERSPGKAHTAQSYHGEEEDNGKPTTAAGTRCGMVRRRGKRRGVGSREDTRMQESESNAVDMVRWRELGVWVAAEGLDGQSALSACQTAGSPRALVHAGL